MVLKDLKLNNRRSSNRFNNFKLSNYRCARPITQCGQTRAKSLTNNSRRASSKIRHRSQKRQHKKALDNRTWQTNKDLLAVTKDQVSLRTRVKVMAQISVPRLRHITSRLKIRMALPALKVH